MEEVALDVQARMPGAHLAEAAGAAGGQERDDGEAGLEPDADIEALVRALTTLWGEMGIPCEGQAQAAE